MIRPLRLVFLLLATLPAIAACNGEGPADMPAQPPNILFILVDDMGYGDLGANGNAVDTPLLDEFAAEGVRFTRNYVDSTCAATRAGILTGTPPSARGFRPSGIGISPETETLPDALRSLGYSTHHIGKWHLGYSTRLAWPLQQGYDSFFGFLNQFVLRGPHPEGKLNIQWPTYYRPWLQVDNEPPQRQEGHLSDLLLGEVLGFLDQASSRSAPWFLNYWTYLPHLPNQPAARFAERYPDTPDGKYRAMLAQLDDAIGQVLQALERNDLAQNTLVVIASDNGGTNKQLDNNTPFVGVKTTFQEGGTRTPLLMRWPDGRGRGTVRDEVVSYFDYFPTLVSAAGGQVPDNLPGRDLAGLFSGDGLAPAELYWDAGDSLVSAWSVLSADGQWRLHRYYVGEPQLNDLAQDPFGTRDVSAANSERVDLMASQLRGWREQQRRVQVDYVVESENGRGRLTGESLQRAPGYGGYTFAIGVTPAAEADRVQVVQSIADQPGQWHMVQSQGQLQLAIRDITLSAPAPAPGKCSSIVVTALHAHRHTHPDKSEALVELYVDGQQVAATRVEQPKLHPDRYQFPTFIGQGSQGGARYHGKLHNPVILNERLRAENESDPWIDNGVKALSDEVCRSTFD